VVLSEPPALRALWCKVTRDSSQYYFSLDGLKLPIVKQESAGTVAERAAAQRMPISPSKDQCEDAQAAENTLRKL